MKLIDHHLINFKFDNRPIQYNIKTKNKWFRVNENLVWYIQVLRYAEKIKYCYINNILESGNRNSFNVLNV